MHDLLVEPDGSVEVHLRGHELTTYTTGHLPDFFRSVTEKDCWTLTFYEADRVDADVQAVVTNRQEQYEVFATAKRAALDLFKERPHTVLFIIPSREEAEFDTGEAPRRANVYRRFVSASGYDWALIDPLEGIYAVFDAAKL